MNSKPDCELLLTDVLSEAAPAEFRGAMLGKTLRLARRKRRFRHVRRVSGVLVLLAVATGAILMNVRHHTVKPQSPSANYQLVKTQPLSADQIVVTHRLGSLQIVASMELTSVVRTRPDSAIRELNDDELLALAPQPAALVRRGPHQMELVILEPANQDNLPVN